MSFSISCSLLPYLYILCYLDSPITPSVDPVLVLIRNVICFSSDFRILNLQIFFLVFPSVPKLLIYNRSEVI